MWILAVAAVAGLVTLGLMLAEVGPFEPEIELPPAPFDPDRYDQEPEPLVLSDIAATTTHPPDGVETYIPLNMVDDDPTTAWRSDGTRFPGGVGETIDLFLAEPVWVDAVVIANGFQRDAEAYTASARVKRALVTFDGGVRFVINLLDEGRQLQIVELDEPMLTTSVRVEIMETFPGTNGEDVAVSDIELRGRTADADDAALARERAELLPGAGRGVVMEPPAAWG